MLVFYLSIFDAASLRSIGKNRYRVSGDSGSITRFILCFEVVSYF